MYVAKRYLTKHIYVCLGSKIPWICMYIAKYLMKKKEKKNKQELKYTSGESEKAEPRIEIHGM